VVTFEVTNEGPSTHEFVILETDLSEHALPRLEREPLVVGVVDEICGMARQERSRRTCVRAPT
jgi:hypothetical protein